MDRDRLLLSHLSRGLCLLVDAVLLLGLDVAADATVVMILPVNTFR